MHSSKTSLVVPHGLKTLLEGVSRAVIENNPDDIIEFVALYFQELVAFRKENPNLDITELVEQFKFVSENGNKELEETTSEHTDTLFSGEPKQMDKCTDTKEDQLLEEPDIEYRSKITQYPSTARSIAESKSLLESHGPSSPEGPDLVYVPAEAAQLAAHVLGNSDSLYPARDVAASVQTLYEDSQTSENEFTPIERAAKDASAVRTAEASLEALRSQPGVWSQFSIAGELGPSDSQADASTSDVNQASWVPLCEEPSPLSPSPAPEEPLQAVPSCHEAEITSTTEVVALRWHDKLIMDAEVPPYVEQFPEKITTPFVDQTAYPLNIEQPLDAGQGSGATTLGPSVDDLVCYPERMESTAQAESAEQVYVLSENGNKELEETTSEHTDTLFSGEPKQMDKCTDTEEDKLLKEPDIEYRSKITQYPSTARSIAESKSLPGSDGASSPEGPDLVYVPAEAAQLAAHVLGNSDSLYFVRDVAASVQTLYKDSQTSENEFTPIERAAKDASAVPAAEASLEALRSQLGVWSQSSIAGELGPSDSQADASTNDVNEASWVPLCEEPSPSPLSPSPAPKEPLQVVPSCHEAEVTSTTEVVALRWAKLIMDAEVPHYIEQFPEKITIPFIDQTAYMLKIEQPLDAGQGSGATTLGPSVDDLVCYPERMESTAQAESAEQVYVLSAMASSEGQPPLHSNVWTLYRLTDLRQGQKSPPSLSPAGAGVPYSQAPLSLSRGKDQQCGQLSQVSAPIYVIQEESKMRDAPPFILVGSNVQNIQDGKPIPQLSQIPAPIYVVQEESKMRDAPPFILVGSNVQNIQDWKSIPQLSQVSAPIYMMQEKCKRDAPPFILVGSNIQHIQDWKPIPSHAAFAQQGTGARRRYTTASVPVARPADEKTDTASPNSNSAEETAAEPCTPHVFSVAIPLDDVISAKKCSPADDKHTG